VTRDETIICVGCPLGCEIKLILSDRDEVIEVGGNKCKEGKQYALEEFSNPVRTLTATVLTKDSSQSLLPVRTSKPILKTLLRQGMSIIAGTTVKPPIKMGDVIVPNLLDTGVDVIATSDLRS
jgi:CxxC motif-containing protein